MRKTSVGVGAILGVLIAGGVAAYRFLLTQEARDSLRNCAAELKKATEKVGKIADRERFSDEETEANQLRTASEWDRLGY